MIEDLTPEELELSALGTLATPEDVRYAVSRGVDEYSFQVDAHVKVWRYLEDRSSRSDVITREDVKVVCGVDLPAGLTDKETLVERLVELSQARRARQAIVSHLDGLGFSSKVKPSATIAELVAELSELSAVGNKGHVRYFDHDATERLNEVLSRSKKSKSGELVGFKTGLAYWDDDNDGFQPGDVVVVLGALNSGKSWLILNMAATAYWYSGAKVLFLSPESTVFDVEARLDAIVSRFMGMSQSNRAIRRGQVDEGEYERYVTALKDTGRRGWVTRDAGDAGVFTVPDIISLAREHRPDILVIDGFHLIKAPGKTYESQKESAEQLKGVAQSLGLTIIAAHQANRDAVLAPDDAPRVGESAYGLGLVQAANRVLSLATRRSNPMHRVFRISKVRDGEVPATRFFLHFDVDNGDIYQIKENVNEDTGMVVF